MLKRCLLLSLVLATSCSADLEPALDEASVIVNNTSVRADASSSSRTLFRLAEGDRVSIVEKVGSWYRIRDQDMFEGWMDESTLLRDSTFEQMVAVYDRFRDAPVQNRLTTLDAVNLRLEPGRDTAVIRRLRPNIDLEVLDRATTPKPDSDATDIWFRVRPSGDPAAQTEEIGWVYSQLVEFDVPEELRAYTEGRTYAAVLVLKEVVDPERGPVRWFVVGERRGGATPEVDYDGIRVFTWNLSEHRYETSLRVGGIRGRYPIEITGADPPAFRFHELDPSGSLTDRNYVMRGTVPRATTP